MDFCIQLSTDYPDRHYGGDRVCSDMLEQARLADLPGYDAVSVTEHHLVKIRRNGIQCMAEQRPEEVPLEISDTPLI